MFESSEGCAFHDLIEYSNVTYTQNDLYSIDEKIIKPTRTENTVILEVVIRVVAYKAHLLLSVSVEPFMMNLQFNIIIFVSVRCLVTVKGAATAQTTALQ